MIESVYVRSLCCYQLVVQGGGLKMQIEAVCASPVYPGDTLYPIQNAIYLVNRDLKSMLKVAAANPFTEGHCKKMAKIVAVMSCQKAKV